METTTLRTYLFWLTCICKKEYHIEIPKGLTFEIAGGVRATCECGHEIYLGPINTWKLDTKGE
jgi:hypothetical protein